jgi:hypothetical protein
LLVTSVVAHEFQQHQKQSTYSCPVCFKESTKYRKNQHLDCEDGIKKFLNDNGALSNSQEFIENWMKSKQSQMFDIVKT